MIGLSEDGGAIKEEGVSGLDADASNTGGGGGFESEGANDGDIEAEVLAGLGNFDHGGFAVSELPATTETFIGALEALNREDGAIFYHNGLSDIEAADFFGDGEAVFQIGEVAGFEAGAGELAGRGEVLIEKSGGEEEGEAGGFEFASDGTEEGCRVALWELGEDEEGFPIRSQVEEIFWGELTGHDGVGGTGFLGDTEEGTELPNAEPFDGIDLSGQRRIGFTGEGSQVNFFDPGGAGFADNQGRISAASGNEEEALRGRKRNVRHRREGRGGVRPSRASCARLR